MTNKRHNPSRGHLALLASAGSGKTTRLCHRYIQMLAGGQPDITPDRICALTFTRKAAGEIFDRIVELLCKGAADSAAAAALAAELAMPALDKERFSSILRLFLDNIHRALIGTMDSFVIGVARAFPIELGIPMNFQISESNDAAGNAMIREIMGDIIAASGSGVEVVLDAFRRATFGVEEKGFERFLASTIPALHLSYRFCPDRTKWGNPERIWGGMSSNVAVPLSSEKLSGHAAIAREWVEEERMAGKTDARGLDSLLEITGALESFSLATPWSTVFDKTLFKRIIEQRERLRHGEIRVKHLRGEIRIAAKAARALGVLTDNLVAVEMRRAVEKTEGLRDLLEIYDRAYEKISRASGNFSFTDVQCLLAAGDGNRGIPLISREPGEGRLFLDYRMDCRLDHWLLDEFQDTSDLQWAVFGNLVSELIQGDPSGHSRSFFYVGDVKQSIYRWRGGNPSLFLDIRDHYNKNGDVIRLEQMSDTRRCSQPVIDTVNKVFSELPTDHLPADTITGWKAVWSKHGTFNKDAKGYAALLQHEQADDPEEARYRLVADLLNEIQPARRGIEIGILTRSNDACSELVNILRRECPGMGFVHEGKFGIIENELAQAILALVRLASHPADNFAWQIVLMTPLAAALKKHGIDRNNISIRLLAEIESGGFLPFITAWGERLAEFQPLNEYGRQCLARLEKAAAGFDANGSLNCNRFLEFMENHEVHEEAARGAVRIMTIHQAKGLGFDAVILPELQHRNRMNMVKADWMDKDMLFGGKPYNPAWILKSPKADVAESDPVLGARLRKIDEDHCFDQLCMLYVAMTRARQALYMITSPQKPGNAFRPASLIKLQLTGSEEPDSKPDVIISGRPHARLYSTPAGDERWYESFAIAEPQGKTAGPGARRECDFSKRRSRTPTLDHFEPSKQEMFERKASDLFDAETRDVMDFGSAIHELFEQIEWLDAVDAETIVNSWKPSKPLDPQVRADAVEQFRKCAASPEVRAALSRPVEGAELWREKSFEIILDGKWVSGVFDRVVIAGDRAGKMSGAAILDYKSNRRLDTEAKIRNKADYYRPQLELYRRALSAILDVAEDRISMQILFTVPARVVRL